jgi:hypothetical protein
MNYDQSLLIGINHYYKSRSNEISDNSDFLLRHYSCSVRLHSVLLRLDDRDGELVQLRKPVPVGQSETKYLYQVRTTLQKITILQSEIKHLHNVRYQLANQK